MNRDISVLFVGDPNLGEAGLEILSRFFRRITPVIWHYGDLEGKASVRRFIRRGRWSLLISFYNDLIFTAPELARADVAVNIHPACPGLPGVGYDVLPLLRRHSVYGATLHRLTTAIDAGEVIEVRTRRLPNHIAHSEFRPLTQALSLELLEHTCRMLAPFSNVGALDRRLASRAAECRQDWGEDYVSRCRLRRILEQVRGENPEHPVFR